MALWGFGAKSGTGVEWSGYPLPQTVTTTRAPAVLKSTLVLVLNLQLVDMGSEEAYVTKNYDYTPIATIASALYARTLIVRN